MQKINILKTNESPFLTSSGGLCCIIYIRKTMPSATIIWFASVICITAADTSFWLNDSPLCSEFANSTTRSSVRDCARSSRNTFTKLALKDLNLWDSHNVSALQKTVLGNYSVLVQVINILLILLTKVFLVLLAFLWCRFYYIDTPHIYIAVPMSEVSDKTSGKMHGLQLVFINRPQELI